MSLGSLALSGVLAILLSLLIRSRRSALELVERRTAELRHQALHDSLTGLPNRLLVNQRAHQLASRAKTAGLPIAVFFIDLDDFKKVNDTLGHEAGDGLLRAVAARLSESVRSTDTVGRLGGDEFVVLSESCFSDGGLGAVAERLLGGASGSHSAWETSRRIDPVDFGQHRHSDRYAFKPRGTAAATPTSRCTGQSPWATTATFFSRRKCTRWSSGGFTLETDLAEPFLTESSSSCTSPRWISGTGSLRLRGPLSVASP